MMLLKLLFAISSIIFTTMMLIVLLLGIMWFIGGDSELDGIITLRTMTEWIIGIFIFIAIEFLLGTVVYFSAEDSLWEGEVNVVSIIAISEKTSKKTMGWINKKDCGYPFVTSLVLAVRLKNRTWRPRQNSIVDIYINT